MAAIEGRSVCSPKLLSRNMACTSSASPLPFLRMRLTVGSPFSQRKLLHCKNSQLCNNHWIVSASKKNNAEIEPDYIDDGENINTGSDKKKRRTRRSRKTSSKETTEEIIPAEPTTDITPDQGETTIESVGLTKELQTEKVSLPQIDPTLLNLVALNLHLEDESESEEENIRPTRRRKREGKKVPDLMKQQVLNQLLEQEKKHLANLEKTQPDLVALYREKVATDDDLDAVSRMWPPLVICFGPAKASFIPYARPAPRIFEQKIHEVMREKYWLPDRFIRAPGSASSSVAIALAFLDGRVEFIGKLGCDSLGQDLLYDLNVNGVQTRPVKIDDSVSTAVSRMKLALDGSSLKAECVEPCAEDSFSRSDINLNILKEAKMLYFNSSALLDPNSKVAVMEAISIMKSQGGHIFFDANLPLLLWHRPEETKFFLKEAFAVSNFIELTLQELDFLCGIEENEADSKYVHRSREEMEEVLHDGLDVLFVTNGTSWISYYTKESDELVKGHEDIQIEPSSCEMSASGDAVVAALMKKLVLELDKATDPSYLGTSIKYAILSGLIAQMLVTQNSGFYSEKRRNDDQFNQTMTAHEDVEEESDQGEEVGELVA